MSALKPCPFCGCTDVSNNDNGDEEWFECDWCHATSGYDPEFEAEPTSFHWNRRTEPSTPSPAGVEVALGEDEMPERIWAGDFDAQAFGHCVGGMQGGLYAEYVRADLAAASLDQATRRAEDAEAEAERWAGVANREDECRKSWQARCSALEQALEHLRRPGNEMANICCNLKQRTNGLLITEERREMADAHREWDEALARAREALSSTASSITEKETRDA